MRERDADADFSWVFDQAPVRVTPTRNGIGHVQVRPPSGPDLESWPAAEPAERAERARVIGRLFVRPHAHASNEGRFLLTRAVHEIRGRGRGAFVDPAESGFPEPFLLRHGFVPVHPGGRLLRYAR